MWKEEARTYTSILETFGPIKNLSSYNSLSLTQLRKRKNFLPLKRKDTFRTLPPASEYLCIWSLQDHQDSELTESMFFRKMTLLSILVQDQGGEPELYIFILDRSS